MSRVVLEIDTCRQDVVSAAVVVDGKRYKKVSPVGGRAQTLLLLIDELLKARGLPHSSISSCIVNAGPGSFTGLRVGIAVANAIGWLLAVPINNQTVGVPVQPKY